MTVNFHQWTRAHPTRIRNFAKKTQKISQKLKKFFFLSHKKKFEKIKIRFLLVVCCIPGKLFLTFQDIKNLCVNNSSRINPMNKQTVIALKNPVNALFYLQVLISEKYKFIYSELSPLLICTWFLKNQFGKIKFDKSISNLNFTVCVACKN